MIFIKQLNGISIEVIYEAFIKAFADYVEPFNLTFQQLKYMIERRGCNLNLSFGAFNGDELVGFTLNGIGEWNGKLTAYDTGTGIIKEFRKRGIATKMFNASLPVLRDNHITQYLLEVIRTNQPAFNLYRKSGFEVTREFNYYISSKDKIEIQESKLNNEFYIKEIDNPNWDLLKTVWDFVPSWQNSIDSINRKNEYFKILGIFDKDHIAGYGIIEKDTGDIPQLGIDKKYRRKGLATTLLHRLPQYSESDEIKIINTCASYDPFKKFADSINLVPGIGQYEMLLKL
ncbi:MAG: GNAT family N-acetyltransferase [Bacteroidales bacterium]|nr:GNAT family N-acetyltransferase [Bacteroidales bacterium]